MEEKNNTKKKRIVFILGGFPVVSHPFLYNQILEVSKDEYAEVKIITLSITNEKVHQVYESLNKMIVYIPMPGVLSFFKRARTGIAAFFSLLFSDPIMLCKSFNFIKYGGHAAKLDYLILANAFKEIDAEIFHCHFGTTGRVIADLKDIGAIKGNLLVSFHGMDITVFPKMYGKEFYRRLFNTADIFTGNSSFIINKMLENGCPQNKTFKIPECLNIEQFQYRKETPDREVFKILTVGRFTEKKGYEYSLKAIALFKKHAIPFEYHIIGEGPLKEEMIDLAKKLGIRQYTIFHGAMKQEELLVYYEDSHVFMLPSVTATNGDTEGQGLVLQEAQAIGLPVLATLHNGFPDSIIEGKTGYLVPEKDVKALYEKLLLFSKNEGLCKEMGKNGRLFVEQNFDSKIVVKQLIELYKDLIS
jgi:colanic acid/amylovoran biosynthesis glycosyltransferase